ncbi:MULTISPECIES: HalOD1 output domain-containing protein [Halorussus]|uniref:HalOD1 output domain-containing protein n=1 Tax=Halorussus TaxID=1070314 RepID=UPI00209D53F2|nr:HalOD1 output domain-containing protein [Halorussus vallis]USZ74850.1 hypothetical protein NGM07_15580 [Halorussus vallis]
MSKANGDPTDEKINVDESEWRQVNQIHYGRESDHELSTVLVFAIAEAKDVDPLDYGAMPPLYDSIDVESVEEMFFGPSGADTEREEEGTVSFHFDDHKVAVYSDGWIRIYEPAGFDGRADSADNSE